MKRNRNQSLGQQTARAVLWMYAQSTGVKFTTLIAQFILMTLLAPDHFGVWSLAMSVRALIDITGRVGMRQILVHRAKHFRRWATPGLWMCVAMGLVASGLLVAAAPFMSDFYNEPQLLGCMLLLAATSPLLASGMVPQARLMADLRFKSIAVIEFVAHTFTLAATVVLAWLGFEAYSFFIPLPFMELIRSAGFWYVSRPKVRFTPQFRRWKYLLGDTGSMFVTNLLQRVVGNTDNLIIGIFHTTVIVGIYGVAYNLSTQAMQVVTANLTQALMPALSKLQDDIQRQVRAFVRAGKVLSAVYTPLCLLQAATCGPLIRLIFPGGKWEAAIPVLQILSIFGVFRVMNGPSMSLLRAQGRFKLNMNLQIVYTLIFLIAVSLAAWLSDEIAVALAVGIVGSMYGPVQIYFGTKPGGEGWSSVLEIYRHTTIFGVIAFGLAWWAQTLVPPPLPNIIYYGSQTLITAALGCGLYLAMLRWLTPGLWNDLIQQLASVNPLTRKKKRKASGDDTLDAPPGPRTDLVEEPEPPQL